MLIEVESKEMNYSEALIFFVFNGKTAGNINIAYNSEITDGLLDVIHINASFRRHVRWIRLCPLGLKLGYRLDMNAYLSRTLNRKSTATYRNAGS